MILFTKMISQVSVSIPDRRDPQAPVTLDGRPTSVSADLVVRNCPGPGYEEPEPTLTTSVRFELDIEKEDPEVLLASGPASDSDNNDNGKEALE